MTRHVVLGSTRAAKGAAALLFSIVGLGCGMPPGQFVIVQNQVPVEGCAIPADVGNAYRGSGDLDVRLVLAGAPFGYAVFPVMQNNLPPAEQGTDLNRIKVSSFEVDVSLPEPADSPGPLQPLFNGLETSQAFLLHYSIPFSASVSSGGGNTSAAVNAIPADLARAIRASGILETKEFAYVTTTIRARGETDSGRSVTSDPFVYPVRVCDGCLIASVSACPVTVVPTHPGNACNIAQDESVDCCTAGSSLVCPPRVAAQ